MSYTTNYNILFEFCLLPLAVYVGVRRLQSLKCNLCMLHCTDVVWSHQVAGEIILPVYLLYTHSGKRGQSARDG